MHSQGQSNVKFCDNCILDCVELLRNLDDYVQLYMKLRLVTLVHFLLLRRMTRKMLRIEMYIERTHHPWAVDGALSPRSERTSSPGGGQPGLGAHQRSSGRRGSGCRLAAGGGSFPSTVR